MVGGSGGSGDGVGRRLAVLSNGEISAGGPIMDRRTGRSTKPFSTPRTVRMASTAKKYLPDEKERNLSLDFLHI